VTGESLTIGKMKVALSNNYVTDGVIYATTTAANGGVIKSTDRGGTFRDTGLVNADSPVSATVTHNGTTYFNVANGLWKTNNLGTGSTWKRVIRVGAAGGPTVGTVILPADFATTNTVFVRLSAISGTDQILKSTNGGDSFTGVGTPDDTQTMNTISCASATQCWTGDLVGDSWYSTDGASTWTKAVTNIGQTVRSFTRSPAFSTDRTIFVRGDSNSGTTEIWMSTDAGANYTQVGTSNGAWGTGTGTGSLSISPNFTTDHMVFFKPTGSSEGDIWRKDVTGTTNWERLGAPTGIKNSFGTMQTTAAPGIGDGILLEVADTTTSQILRTYYPKTINQDNWTKRILNGVPTTALTAGNLFGVPLLGPASTAIADTDTSNGRTWNVVIPAARRWGVFTNTPAFLAPPTLVQPADGGATASCSGLNGQTILFSWSTIDRVQAWDIQVALDPDFNSLVIDTTANRPVGPGLIQGTGSSNPLFTVGTGSCVLVDGQKYYFRVRAEGVGTTSPGVEDDGPWSQVRSFSVGNVGAPTAPAPQLPADNSTMPNLGPIQLSWNNPSGATQFEIQVIPLNNDGPGIDLIIGDPALVAAASYTIQPPVMGQGNYIILPGATYNWRVRTSRAPGSIGPTDPSWGPFSDVRTFKTPRPNAGTISVQPVTPSDTPTIEWKDSNVNDFYYEVQLSQDRTFNADPASATAAVYWNLVHGGLSNPLDSWTLPSGVTLEKGKTYYYRVRQRVQATALGADEPGIPWSGTQSFVAP
jgi:hypothetical protein